MKPVVGAALSAALLFLAGPSLAQPPKPCDDACLEAAYLKAIDQAKAGRYMDSAFGLLAQIGVERPDQIKDPDVFDQFSQVWSAMTNMPADNRSKAPYSHVSPDQVAALRAARAIPAIPEIVARARRTRLVILDEDHLAPRDRAFGLQVARALRPLGYSVLAVETLTRDRDDAVSRGKMEQLAKDGYVRRSSGYYTNDPVFADFLRQAMAMGYRIVSYESAGFTDEKDDTARTVRREQEQAENVARRALADPAARVLVYSGRHHAAEAPITDPKVPQTRWMAQRLKELTGIDPLTIDQVELGEQPADRQDVDLYAAAGPKATAGSRVMMQAGRPLVVGLLAGGVDLQVVHPRTHRTDGGRPDWLASLGRRPADVPRDLLPVSGRRLVQAFLANEADDAIPIDQVLVIAGQPPPKLMLPPGARVRYAVQDDPRAAVPAS